MIPMHDSPFLQIKIIILQSNIHHVCLSVCAACERCVRHRVSENGLTIWFLFLVVNLVAHIHILRYLHVMRSLFNLLCVWFFWLLFFFSTFLLCIPFLFCFTFFLSLVFTLLAICNDSKLTLTYSNWDSHFLFLFF